MIMPVPFFDILGKREEIDDRLRSYLDSKLLYTILVGQLYYSSYLIDFGATKEDSAGVGGHFSGSGMGTIFRKYGLAADNIVDANMINANGRVLNKKSMGKIFFGLSEAAEERALESFSLGKYSLQLAPVSSTVTVFTIRKTLEQGATNLI
ncbi:hypothetical protein Vadar_018272 [Vaccinium darrowii]|uniref:Uncharacterized protein n=1 Tax=Vaccinium darrowii TaxID=229202 RepID=A0ACB7Y7S4_9ERIC|nr:hypothetical protein Vadar_018272 [Vaccinium darrowii]